jgi:hypothetical protein
VHEAGGATVTSTRKGGVTRPIVSAAAISAGLVALAARNLKQRKRVI